MGARVTPLRAPVTAGWTVPDHRSYRGLGSGGFHRLHYCDWGERDNPRVVVCVHGARGNGRDFDALARSLSAQFRVICPDLAGRGECEWLGTARPLEFPQLVADLSVLLSCLEVEEVDWIGSSLGGILGQHLAAQRGTPIRRLMLCGDQAPVSPGEIDAVRRFLLEEAGIPRREACARA